MFIKTYTNRNVKSNNDLNKVKENLIINHIKSDKNLYYQ